MNYLRVKQVYLVVVVMLFFHYQGLSAGIKEETGYNKPAKPTGVSKVKPKPVSGDNKKTTTITKPVTTEVAKPVSPTSVGSGGSQYFGNITLRFDPLTLRTLAGSSTATQKIVLDNPRGVTLDTVDILIKFDPRYLKVADVYPGQSGVNIKSLIDPKRFPGIQIIFNYVDSNKGLIRFMLKGLKDGVYLGGEIAEINWRPIKPILQTPLAFQFSSEPGIPGTAISKNSKDVLGSSYEPQDGVLSGGVIITSR